MRSFVKQILFIYLVSFSLFVYACKKTDDGLTPVDPEITSSSLTLMVDNGFTKQQKKSIKRMFDKYDNMKFGSDQALYRIFFGGDSIDALTKFINKRIKYFIPVPERELEKSFGSATKAIGAGYSLSWLAPVCDAMEGPPRVICNGRLIELKGSRHGVVVSGPAFFYDQTTDIEKISIIAHEARHADCPVKPGSYSACSLLLSPDLVDKEERRCGNIHAKCSSSDQARACENLSWGSYAVSYVVLKKIYQDCLNCSEKERQIALLLSNEYYKRFKVDDVKEIFEGTPDLSSYDE